MTRHFQTNDAWMCVILSAHTSYTFLTKVFFSVEAEIAPSIIKELFLVLITNQATFITQMFQK